MKHETRYALGFNKYNEPIDPEIKINMFDKSKVKKSSKLIGQKYFEVITQNNIFLVASMEVKSQLDTLHRFLGFFFFFSVWVFFHEHSRITGLQRKREGISLTSHYHFHPLHGHLDISRAITAESLPLRIASSQARTGNLWFPSASR